MTVRRSNTARTLEFSLAGLLCAAFLILIVAGSPCAWAQESKQAQPVANTGGNAKLIARGKYIVEGVAGCGYCHTPRDKNGEPDRTKWLAGAPVFYEPAQPVPGWPNTAPRLAGLPPGSDAELLTLLTTSTARTGQLPRWPMPRFHMTRADAEAVVAYLRSINPSH